MIIAANISTPSDHASRTVKYVMLTQAVSVTHLSALRMNDETIDILFTVLSWYRISNFPRSKNIPRFTFLYLYFFYIQNPFAHKIVNLNEKEREQIT